MKRLYLGAYCTHCSSVLLRLRAAHARAPMPSRPDDSDQSLYVKWVIESYLAQLRYRPCTTERGVELYAPVRILKAIEAYDRHGTPIKVSQADIDVCKAAAEEDRLATQEARLKGDYIHE